MRAQEKKRRPARSESLASLVALIVGSLAIGCGDATPTSRTPAGHGATRSETTESAAAGHKTTVAHGEQQGLASYYADSLAGRKTASGEPYDPAELTAAHRTLPLGTRIEVVRDDGRSVTVRVNDRGPFGSKKRIVDLSRRAAEALGMMRAGVVPVTVRILQKPAKK